MKNSFYVFLLVLILGLALRFWPAVSTELWLDESLSFSYTIENSYLDLLFQSNQYHDIHHPPYYYLLLKIWLSFFANNELNIRMLSIIFFPMTMLVIFNTGRKFFSESSGLFSSAFIAFHPLMVNLGFQARMYVQSLFFASVGTYFLLGMLEKKFLIKRAALVGAFFSLSFYFDYTMLWIFPAFLFMSVYYLFKKKKSLFGIYSKVLFFTTFFSLFQFFNLVKDYFSVENIGPGSLPWDQFGLNWILVQIVKLLGVFAFDYHPLAIVTLLMFVFFYLFSIFCLKKNIYLDHLSGLLFFYLLSPLLVSALFQPMFLARNTSYAVVLLSLIFGEFISRFLSKDKLWLKKTIVFFMFFGIFVNSVKREGFEFEGGLQRFVESIAISDRVLYLLPGINRDIFAGYYFYKNSVPKERLVELNKENFLAVMGNKTNKKHFVFSGYCDDDDTCRMMKQGIYDNCKSENGCEYSQR